MSSLGASFWTAIVFSVWLSSVSVNASDKPPVTHPPPTHPTTRDPSRHTTTPHADCPWASWNSWSKCDCRLSIQTRIRDLKVIPEGQCEIRGCGQEMRECSRSRCPVDCVLSKWSSWSRCHGPCGEGLRKRYRSIRVPALYGGKRCKGRMTEEERCEIFGRRCSEDCDVGSWAEWSPCSWERPCECSLNVHRYPVVGFQLRERPVVRRRGHHCPELRETKQCHTTCC